jgi:hypothetical protein
MKWRIWKGFSEWQDDETGDSDRILWRIEGEEIPTAGRFSSTYKAKKKEGGSVDRESPDIAQYGMALAYGGGVSGQPVPAELVNAEGAWIGSEPLSSYRGAAWHPYRGTPSAVVYAIVPEERRPVATPTVHGAPAPAPAAPPAARRRSAAQLGEEDPAPRPPREEPARRVELVIKLDPESILGVVEAFSKIDAQRAKTIVEAMQGALPGLLALVGEGALGRALEVEAPSSPRAEEPPVDDA